MLRVVEEAARTDTGRERHANEDAYLARAPVFVVADGMGGARAGEVAAQIATDAFEDQLGDGGNPEEELATVASEANRKIFDLARSDSSRSGMGTTLTGALLRGDEVSIVHVGDSRAYLFRDGELRQLTRDHSLVEELRRQGRLTSEEAEEHPQRSIITRALGPEPEVELDVHTHQARAGDVFLLCSDGLTSMVREQRLKEILEQSKSLTEAVDKCVREANRSGGRDNITVVLFRLAGDGEETPPPETLDDTATDLPTVAPGPAPKAEPARAPKPERVATATRDGRLRRRFRIVAAGALALLVLGGIAFGVAAVWRNTYFIGQDERGLVALYRGFPYELPAGIELYQTKYVSSVQAGRLRPFERRRLLDHELRSRDDAADRIRELERAR